MEKIGLNYPKRHLGEWNGAKAMTGTDSDTTVIIIDIKGR